MALASIAAALTQFDANIGEAYTDNSAAKATLEAINYLLVHRGSATSVAGRSVSFEALEKIRAELAEDVQAGNTSRPAFCARAVVKGGGYGY